jgi:ubiquinone/menaquinone biosynthesis C-methylase UbiE
MADPYHLAELKIALDAGHPAHILPPALPASHRVLDVGCGAGQTLFAAYPGHFAVGLDPDIQALRLGRTITRDINFLCSQAEAIPFADASFDMVIARVSLAYTHIDRSLREIRRVLRRGGEVWMTLHPFSIPFQAARKGNFHGWIFFGYIVANSLLFHFTRRQFAFLGKYESFQTETGILRALQANGFGDIAVSRDRHFLVQATAHELR